MTNRLYLCCSSSIAEQYRRDILRALARPKGSVIQFRYEQAIVDDAVKSDIRTVRGGRALIAYVDRHRNAELDPVRYAEIVDIEPFGSAYAVYLKVGEFCAVESIRAFNEQTRAATGNRQPNLRSAGFDGWFFVASAASEACKPTTQLLAFEKTVGRLFDRDDFKSEKLFYHVCGIRTAGREEIRVPADGEHILDANRSYDIEIVQFHPALSTTASLVIESGTPNVVVTNPHVHFESGYDLRHVRLRTLNPGAPPGRLPSFLEHDDKAMEHTASVLSIFRQVDPSDEKTRLLDFDLSIRIRPDTASAWSTGAVFGAALSVPPLVSIWAANNAGFSATARILASIITIIAFVVVGYMTASGQRKPGP